MFSYTRPAAKILDYGKWQLGNDAASPHWKAVRVAEGVSQGRRILARIDGVDSRECAGALIGKTLVAEEGLEPPTRGL